MLNESEDPMANNPKETFGSVVQAPVAPVAPVVVQAPPVVSKKRTIYDDDHRYASFKIVNIRLLKEGTIQYDPNYPELVLNSSEPEGQPMPLTPFFSSRINQTIELVF
jgi:hypothetical protein